MEVIKAMLTQIPTLRASMADIEIQSVAGAKSHDELTGRDAAEQHPISAITGLCEALHDKLSEAELTAAVDSALLQAKESGEFDGADGKNGVDGKDGADGKDGVDGKDGISPTVSVSKSGKTTTITITDAAGTKTATVMDGEDGSTGEGGGYTPVKGVDYFTEEDKEEFVDLVLAALPTWTGGSY